MEDIVLNRYEIARILGLRALQIEEGAAPAVKVVEYESSLKTAAREMLERELDVLVCRNGKTYPIRSLDLPREFYIMFHATL